MVTETKNAIRRCLVVVFALVLSGCGAFGGDSDDGGSSLSPGLREVFLKVEPPKRQREGSKADVYFSFAFKEEVPDELRDTVKEAMESSERDIEIRPDLEFGWFENYSFHESAIGQEASKKLSEQASGDIPDRYTKKPEGLHYEQTRQIKGVYKDAVEYKFSKRDGSLTYTAQFPQIQLPSTLVAYRNFPERPSVHVQFPDGFQHHFWDNRPRSAGCKDARYHIQPEQASGLACVDEGIVNWPSGQSGTVSEPDSVQGTMKLTPSFEHRLSPQLGVANTLANMRQFILAGLWRTLPEHEDAPGAEVMANVTDKMLHKSLSLLGGPPSDLDLVATGWWYTKSLILPGAALMLGGPGAAAATQLVISTVELLWNVITFQGFSDMGQKVREEVLKGAINDDSAADYSFDESCDPDESVGGCFKAEPSQPLCVQDEARYDTDPAFSNLTTVPAIGKLAKFGSKYGMPSLSTTGKPCGGIREYRKLLDELECQLNLLAGDLDHEMDRVTEDVREQMSNVKTAIAGNNGDSDGPVLAQIDKERNLMDQTEMLFGCSDSKPESCEQIKKLNPRAPSGEYEIQTDDGVKTKTCQFGCPENPSLDKKWSEDCPGPPFRDDFEDGDLAGWNKERNTRPAHFDPDSSVLFKGSSGGGQKAAYAVWNRWVEVDDVTELDAAGRFKLEMGGDKYRDQELFIETAFFDAGGQNLGKAQFYTWREGNNENQISGKCSGHTGTGWCTYFDQNPAVRKDNTKYFYDVKARNEWGKFRKSLGDILSEDLTGVEPSQVAKIKVTILSRGAWGASAKGYFDYVELGTGQ